MKTSQALKTFHVGYVNNSGAAYMVVAENREQAKRKVCSILDVAYPNNYLTAFKNGIGKTCLGLIK